MRAAWAFILAFWFLAILFEVAILHDAFPRNPSNGIPLELS